MAAEKMGLEPQQDTPESQTDSGEEKKKDKAKYECGTSVQISTDSGVGPR
jgi:hypothetical protein